MSSVCSICRRPKAAWTCEVCEADLCKNCVQFVEPETFSFLKELPDELRYSRYCLGCHEERVSPALLAYENLMERARNLYVFFKTQKRPPPILKRSKEILREENRTDRDDTLLRLAFSAAEQGYNALIEAEVIAIKTRQGAYQKALWQGTAIAAQVDVERLERVTRGH